MDNTPLGYLKSGLGAVALGVKLLFKLDVTELYGQRPTQSKLLSLFDEVLCSTCAELDGSSYLTNR
jgi:hypothetical protein